MKSKIYARDLVKNSNRAFGAAEVYYTADFQDPNGEWHFVAFTEGEMSIAMSRGIKNQEDRPLTLWERFKSLWSEK